MESELGELKSLNDLQLIDLSLRGNMRAFEVIIKRYESAVARVTISMLGNEAADDVGQEVFLRFYSSMKKFKGDSKLGTYLVRIAINLSLNEIKKNTRYSSGNNDNIENNHGSYNLEEEADTRSIIQYSLNLLEPEFRTVVVLRNIEGYSTRETAEILNIPQGTVLSRLSRGHQKLKEIITKLDVL